PGSSTSPRCAKARRSFSAGASARTRLHTGTGWKKGSQDASDWIPNRTSPMHSWQRLLTAAIVVVATFVLPQLVGKALSRRELAPEVTTRYRTVRRVVTTTILFVGILSALLVIPQVRAVAGGILASSAVVGLVIGFAAQRTLGNAIAGIMIAFSQPLRLGDTVIIDDVEGIVEEIGLTYTFIRTAND